MVNSHKAHLAVRCVWIQVAGALIGRMVSSSSKEVDFAALLAPGSGVVREVDALQQQDTR